MPDTEDRLLETVTSSPLALTDLKRDGGTQTRERLDIETVTRYADDMRRGDIFPPIVVYYDGTDYWLADGFHRVEAAFQAHGSSYAVATDIRQGTRRDAVLHSAGANAHHGLPRSNDDKRRAVQAMLTDEEWSLWSDRKIAETTHTTHPFVGKIRTEMFPDGASGERRYTRDGEEQTMNTATINANRAQPAAITLDDVTDVDKDQVLGIVTREGPIHRNILERRVREDFTMGARVLAATLGALLKDKLIVQGADLRFSLPDSREETRTARNADHVTAFLKSQPPGWVSWKVVMTGANIKHMDEFSKAIGLLEGPPARIKTMMHVTGKMIALVTPPAEAPEETRVIEGANTLDADTLNSYAEVVCAYLKIHGETHFDTLAGVFDLTPGELSAVLSRSELQGKVRRKPGNNYRAGASELNAHFDQSKITLLGRTDNGAWHRAIEVARKLVAANLWDGSKRIEFDAYALHDKLFGANRDFVGDPVPGVDFIFVDVPQIAAPLTTESDTPAALILSILHYATEPITAPQINNQVEDRLSGQHLSALVMSDALNELIASGEIVQIERADRPSFPLYALAEQSAVPFKSPSPVEPESAAPAAQEPERDDEPRPVVPSANELNAILESLAGVTETEQRAAWHGEEIEPTPADAVLVAQGKIRPVYKWSSGSRWLVGYVLFNAPRTDERANGKSTPAADPEPKYESDTAPAVHDFERPIYDAKLAIQAAMKNKPRNLDALAPERRAQAERLLRETHDEAAKLLIYLAALGVELKTNVSVSAGA